MRQAALAALAVALAAPAHAAPDPSAADVAQMAQLFDSLCLQAFPDNRAIDGAVAQLHGQALTPPQVRSILHDDPGRGWRIARPEATYLVTIEEPPYRACAVRRMTRAGFPGTQPYTAAIDRYAASRGRGLGAPLSQAVHTKSGLDIRAWVQQVPGGAPDGSTDSLMLFLTDYHGGYDGPLAADAGAPGVEVRFVHQLRAPGMAP